MSPITTQNPLPLTEQAVELSAQLPVGAAAGFHYLHAVWLRRTGQLTQAKLAYVASNQPQGVVRAALELARLAHPQESWPLAQHYLFDEVQPFFDQHLIDDPTLQAHCYLQMADVARDQGDWVTGAHYAYQALTQYGALDHAYGQVMAHIWLIPYALNSGDRAGAEAHLQQAHEQATIAKLGQPMAARLLYGELLLAWYQRSLTTALPLAQQYLAAANSEVYSLEQIEARLLLGNLYRDSGDYRTAHSWYEDAGAVIEQLGYRAYVPRLQADLAWLYLLEGELSVARALVEEQIETTLLAQHTALQVILAVLQMMDGEWEAADALLAEAQAFYEKGGDALALCTVRLYRAYNALHQTETAPTLQHLTQALRWLDAHQLTTFPQWWHTKILAEVCTHALLSNLYPALVEKILVQQLGKASLPFLKLLDTTDDIELRRQALRLQQMISGGANPAAHLPASLSKRVIEELLAQGHLRAEAYRELETELMTAANRLTPNPTIIAVFGLYVQGWTRADIAAELQCSTENVRNYITIIYNHFGLPAYRFHKREARRQKLIDVAQTRGFIY
jgi:tetratricopeptide (TPR) repeat protein